MNKEQATDKVKLLLRLAASAPENEARAAKAMADKLIEKYELIEEDCIEKEPKPIYTDDAFLFEELIPTNWRPSLALVCANKFDCYVIKEENKALLTGEITNKYFVYGHEDDVVLVKELFRLVVSKTEELIETKCKKRGALYTSSYAEGVVNGCRINIEQEDFDKSALVKKSEEKPEPKLEAAPENKETQSIEKIKKEQPIKEVSEAKSNEQPLDILAFWDGEADGMRKIHIGKYDEKQYEDLEFYDDEEKEDLSILELALEKIKGLVSNNEKT